VAILPDSCLGCRGCCTNSGVNVFDTDDNRITVEMTVTTITPNGRVFRWMKHKENKECIALNEAGQCSIYEYRPQVCKDFERGCTECLDSLDRLGGV